MAKTGTTKKGNIQETIRQVRSQIEQEMEFNEFKLSHNKEHYQFIRTLGAGTYGQVALMQYDSRNDRSHSTTTNGETKSAENCTNNENDSEYTEFYAMKSV